MSFTCPIPRKPLANEKDDSASNLELPNPECRLGTLCVDSAIATYPKKEYHSVNAATVRVEQSALELNDLNDSTCLKNALETILQQVNNNLRFTKAIYKGTKKRLVGPGYQPTRLYDKVESQDVQEWTSDRTQVSTMSPVWRQVSSARTMSPARRQRSPGTASPGAVQRQVSPGIGSPVASSLLSARYNGLDVKRHTSQHTQYSRTDPKKPRKSTFTDNLEAASMAMASAHLGECEYRRGMVTSMQDLTAELTKHHSSMRQRSMRVWRFFEDKTSSRLAHMYFHLRNTLLLFSITLAFYEVIQESKRTFDSDDGEKAFLLYVQIGIEVLYVSEILLRYCACRNRAAFWSSGYNIIDALSVLPCVLRVSVLVGQYQSAVVVSLFGMVPVLRSLKVLRHFDTFQLLLEAFIAAAEAVPVLLFSLFLLISAFASMIYYCEPRTSIPSFPDALYFGIITVSTVGYGDIHPETAFGKIWMSLLAVIGPMYMAIPIGIIGNAFSLVWQDRHHLFILHRMRRCITNAGYSPSDLKHMFELLDSNEDGTLDIPEFASWLNLMEIHVSDDFVRQVFDSFDADATDCIHFDDLLRGLFPHTHRHVHQKALKAQTSANTFKCSDFQFS